MGLLALPHRSAIKKSAEAVLGELSMNRATRPPPRPRRRPRRRPRPRPRRRYPGDARLVSVGVAPGAGALGRSFRFLRARRVHPVRLDECPRRPPARAIQRETNCGFPAIPMALAVLFPGPR